MRVLVMGSGAVGGYFGALLYRQGHQVTFVARGQHLEAIRRRGLRVTSVTSGDFTIRPSAVERPDGSWKADLALFTVKSYHNEEAIRVMAPAVGNDTLVLTLQNGLGSGDQLAAAFGARRVLLGAAYVEAARPAPGAVAEMGGPCRIVFGPMEGPVTSQARAVAKAFEEAGVEAVLTQEVLRELWRKLVFICALSGLTCVTRSSFREVMDTPETASLVPRVMEEVVRVARAQGVALDEAVVEENMEYFRRHKGELVSSMHQDLEAGRPLELDALNGAVVRLGKARGIETTVNEFIVACLRPAHLRALAGGRAGAENDPRR